MEVQNTTTDSTTKPPASDTILNVTFIFGILGIVCLFVTIGIVCFLLRRKIFRCKRRGLKENVQVKKEFDDMDLEAGKSSDRYIRDPTSKQTRNSKGYDYITPEQVLRLRDNNRFLEDEENDEEERIEDNAKILGEQVLHQERKTIKETKFNSQTLKGETKESNQKCKRANHVNHENRQPVTKALKRVNIKDSVQIKKIEEHKTSKHTAVNAIGQKSGRIKDGVQNDSEISSSFIEDTVQKPKEAKPSRNQDTVQKAKEAQPSATEGTVQNTNQVNPIGKESTIQKSSNKAKPRYTEDKVQKSKDVRPCCTEDSEQKPEKAKQRYTSDTVQKSEEATQRQSEDEVQQTKRTKSGHTKDTMQKSDRTKSRHNESTVTETQMVKQDNTEDSALKNVSPNCEQVHDTLQNIQGTIQGITDNPLQITKTCRKNSFEPRRASLKVIKETEEEPCYENTIGTENIDKTKIPTSALDDMSADAVPENKYNHGIQTEVKNANDHEPAYVNSEQHSGIDFLRQKNQLEEPAYVNMNRNSSSSEDNNGEAEYANTRSDSLRSVERRGNNANANTNRDSSTSVSSTDSSLSLTHISSRENSIINYKPKNVNVIYNVNSVLHM